MSVSLAMDPAEALTTAVQSCPAVAGMSAGRFGEVATYLPGRRVTGVRLADRIEVHVVARWPVPAMEVAVQVRAACVPFAAGKPVDVYVDDLALPAPPAAG